jgi:hypothetical protein
MRTPAGTECRYYYQDFHRGRDLQECRNIKANPFSLAWMPSDCGRCPVPGILNANSSPDLELKVTVKSKMLGFRRYIEVTAFCLRHGISIENPYTGCPLDAEERRGLDIFRAALDSDSSNETDHDDQL